MGQKTCEDDGLCVWIDRESISLESESRFVERGKEMICPWGESTSFTHLGKAFCVEQGFSAPDVRILGAVSGFVRRSQCKV